MRFHFLVVKNKLISIRNPLIVFVRHSDFLFCTTMAAEHVNGANNFPKIFFVGMVVSLPVKYGMIGEFFHVLDSPSNVFGTSNSINLSQNVLDLLCFDHLSRMCENLRQLIYQVQTYKMVWNSYYHGLQHD